MKPKTALRSFLAAIGASMIVLSSAAAQTTYTWENSNTAEPTPTALDWFSGGDNAQGAWIDANTPVSGNTNTIQIFEDTSTALTGWTGTLDQAVVVNHGSPFELGTLTLSGRGNNTINNILRLNMAGDALRFSAATGTINLNATQPAANRRIEHNISNEIQLGTTSSGTVLTITGGGNSTFQLLGGINELQTGGGGVEKSGTSTLQLRGTSNFSGGLTMAGGTTQLTSTTDSLGAAGAAITVTANSTLNFGVGGTHTIDKTLHVNDGITFTTIKGANGTSTITGIVSGGDTSTIRVNDAGGVNLRPLILSNTANTFTGTVDLLQNRATMRVASIGDAVGAGNILLGRASQNAFYLDATANTSLVLNHRQFEIAGGGVASNWVQIQNENTASSSANTFTINTDLLVNSLGGTKEIRLGGTNIGANTFAGAIVDGAEWEDASEAMQPGTVIRVLKQDAGKWILNGANTYTGTTTITAGTLVVNGSLDAASAVAVNGGTLGGSGIIGGSVTVAAAANLAPGASVGSLSIGGSLDISAMAGGSGKLFYELGPIAASDQIAVTGMLAIGDDVLGLGDFDLTEVGGLEEGVYTLITSGGINGTLDSGNLVANLGEDGPEITLGTSGGSIILTVGEVIGGGSPYEDWATGGELFGDDTNGDGVSNGLAFLLGASGPNANALGLLPTVIESDGGLVMTFSTLNSASRGTAALRLEHSSDLGISDTWTTVLVPDTEGISGPTSGVTFNVTLGSPSNTVTATISSSEAASGKLFGRLKATE